MSPIWIEAIHPVRFQHQGKQVELGRGERVNLPVLQAQRLLSRAKDRVRLVKHMDWLNSWQRVAQVSNGLTREDPRLGPALNVIEGLDRAFAADDWSAFEQGIRDLQEAMKNGKKRDA